MRPKRSRGLVPLLLLSLTLVGAGWSAEARTARERSAEPRASSSADRGKSAARARTPAPRTRASGTATYGHTRYRRPPVRGHYPYRGWGWGYYPFAYGAWWYYAPPRTPVYVVTAEQAAELPVFVETAIRPKRASVLVDGELLGQARDFNASWQALELAAGSYEFEFRHPGHQTLRLVLELKPGRYYRIEERLAEGEGPDPRSRDLPPPPQEPGYAEEPNAAAPAAPALAPGLLHVRVLPEDAAIYLDGEYLGLASELARLHGALPVAAGRHRLEIVRPGYRSVERTIDLEADEPLRVEVELRRDGG